MSSKRNVKSIKKISPVKGYKGYKSKRIVTVRRGDVYYADLNHATIGSEQGGTRPVLIIQNDKGNIHSPTVIAAAITSQNKRGLPTHIELKDECYGLSKNSTIMLEQVRTIDKTRLRDKLGHLDKEVMEKVDKAIFISFGIDKYNNVLDDFVNENENEDNNGNESEHDSDIADILDSDSNDHANYNINRIIIESKKTERGASRIGMRKHKSELTKLAGFTKRKGRRGSSPLG